MHVLKTIGFCLVVALTGCSSLKKLSYGNGLASADTSYLNPGEKKWFEENRQEMNRDEAKTFLYETNDQKRAVMIRQMKVLVETRKADKKIAAKEQELDDQQAALKDKIETERQAKADARHAKDETQCKNGVLKACRSLVLEAHQNEDKIATLKYSDIACIHGDKAMCEFSKTMQERLNTDREIADNEEAKTLAAEQERKRKQAAIIQSFFGGSGEPASKPNRGTRCTTKRNLGGEIQTDCEERGEFDL